MTRRADGPDDKGGGHAGDRRGQFERERGLSEGRELDLPLLTPPLLPSGDDEDEPVDEESSAQEEE